MPIFLVEHLDGCSPLTPCTSCKANEWLKAHLPVEKYSEFVALVIKSSNGKTSANLDARVSSVLELSARVCNCLKNNNIITLRELMDSSEAKLLDTPNFGRKGIEELREKLARIGLSIPKR